MSPPDHSAALAAGPGCVLPPPAPTAVSAVLRGVVERAQGQTITARDIIDALGERGFGFALILFSLPNCVPFPPGLAQALGLPVFLFAMQMLVGRTKPWLPRRIMDKAFPLSAFRRVIDAAEPRLRKVEGVCRPRLTFLFGPRGERLIGLFAALCAVSVMIPLPGTNIPPSIALVLVSLAVMEEDGYLLLAGLAIGTAGILYTAFITAAIGTFAWVAAASALGL
jgi:hypothetical protein